MRFLQPWMLLGLLAAAVPVIVHLMNRQRAQRVRFPMFTLVSKSQEQRAPALKIKRWLLMAARIGLLLLIPLAMAQPYALCGQQPAARGAREPTAVVVIVDVSASMGRVQGNLDVRKEAAAKARSAIEALRPWDRVRVLAAGSEPHWLNTQWGTDHKAALKTLQDIPWEAGKSDLPLALSQARAALSEVQLPRKRVVLITDNDAGAWAPDTPKPDTIQAMGELTVVPISPDPTDLELSISNLSWEPAPSGGADMVQINVEIKAHGAGSIDTKVRLQVDGENIGVQRVSVNGGGHTQAQFTYTFKDDGAHAVRVSVEGDGVRGAQTRWTPVYLAKAVNALLVDGDSSAAQYNDELYYLTRALNVDIGERQRVHYTVATPGRLDADAFADKDVVLLANVESLDSQTVKALRAFVHNGGGLWITPGSLVNPAQYNRLFGDLLPQPLRSVTTLSQPDDPDANIRATRFASIDYHSPLFRVFSMPGGESLQSARVFQYLLLKPDPTSSAKTLVSYADGGPAVVEKNEGAGKVLLWTTSLDQDWTDLPIRTAYVPLVHRTMRYLAQRGASDAVQSVVGKPITFELTGLSVEKMTLRTSDKERFILDVKEGEAHIVPTETGLYRASLVRAGERSRAPSYDFAVHIPPEEAIYTAVDPAVPKAWVEAAAQGAPTGDLADVKANRRPMWPTFLLIGLLLIYAESLLGIRRRVWATIFGRHRRRSPG